MAGEVEYNAEDEDQPPEDEELLGLPFRQQRVQPLHEDLHESVQCITHVVRNQL